ncbi:MAG TPA: sugar ABC transporter permease [Pseudolysinimonas sp.]|nr:sugar ABC transporter permease [Pseudolysinimonas sp.]
MSTLQWNGISPNPTFVGADNYVRLFQDPIVAQALWHTLAGFLIGFPAATAIGIVMASLLHSRIRLATVHKVILFIPVVLSPAVTAPVFRQIFSIDGQLNWVLEHVGLGFLSQPWLAQSSTALLAVVAVGTWHGAGISFILYYAAMGQIEPEILEAARLDGAGNLRTLVSIVWPDVRGTTLALATLSVIWSLKTFDLPYLITTAGPNFATEYLGTFIYRWTITNGSAGYGAAASILLLVLALGIGIALNVRRRSEGSRDV